MKDRAQEEKPSDRRATTLLVGLLPAGFIVAVSFVQAEILHRAWDRLNAILCVLEPSRSNVNDALPALNAARVLLESRDAPIYDMSNPNAAAFLYPPIAAALYVPHVLQGDAATWSLYLWNRRVLFVIAVLLGAALVGPRKRWPTPLESLCVLCVLALFLPAMRALELNQASLSVALFLGASWVALDRGAEATAGVFLAFAGAIKPHLFAIAPLLFFHARRTAVSTALTFAALLSASLAFASLSNHITYVTHVLPEASRGYAYVGNQSFGGLLHRLFYEGSIDVFTMMDPNPLVMRATLVLAALAYGGTFFLLWRTRARKDLSREAFALAWLVTTMIAPIAWGHHYIAVLFPLMWLVGRIRDGEEQNAKSLAPVAMGCALLGSLFVVSGLVGALPRLLASYSLFGALIVAFAFAFRFVTAQRT